MYADILILASLWNGSRHGYEIRQSAGAMFGGSCLLNNNQLYPLLRRFESDGIVTSATQAQAGRPDRHVYTLTRVGKALLRRRLGEFPEGMSRDDREFLIRVHLFHLIDVRARRRILKTRLEALQERLERTAVRLGSAETKRLHYVTLASQLVESRTRLEIDWIGRMLRTMERTRGSGSELADVPR